MLSIEFFPSAVVETRHPWSKLSFILQSSQVAYQSTGIHSSTWRPAQTLTKIHTEVLTATSKPTPPEWCRSPHQPFRTHLPTPLPGHLGYHSQNTFISSKKQVMEQIYTCTFSEFKWIYNSLCRYVHQCHSTTKIQGIWEVYSGPQYWRRVLNKIAIGS